MKKVVLIMAFAVIGAGLSKLLAVPHQSVDIGAEAGFQLLR